jgi:hypothetical protein
VVPVKVVKNGPFKDVLKLLRTGLGDRFKHYIGSDKTFMPLNYHDNFDQSGKFSVRSGNTDSMAQMLRDVLGDGYEVTVGNREILLKIKDGKENTKPE